MSNAPKFSELDNIEREQVVEYVKGRWSQYYKVTRETRKDAAKLVAVVNAGGAAAILAFMGALAKEVSPLAQSLSLRLTLGCFVSGIAFSAVAHAVEYARLRGLFDRWRRDVNDLYADKLTFENMQAADIERSGENDMVSGFFVWGALVFFLVGSSIGIGLFF